MSQSVRLYRLSPASLPAEEELIRKALTPTLLLILVVSTVGLVILGIRGGTPTTILIGVSVVLAALTVYVAIWSPRRMIRRLRMCWESYELEIGPDYFLRRQGGLPDLRLNFSEVRAAEQISQRYLRLIGKQNGLVISIPQGIERFDEVLAAVSLVLPIKSRRVQEWQKHRLLMAAGIALFTAMLWFNSPKLVIALCIATSAVIVWTFLWIRRNPNISRKVKLLGWIYLLFLTMCALKLLVAVEDLMPSHGPR